MTDLEKIFKSLIWDAIVTAAVNALIAAVPFLSFGPLAFVVSLIIRKVGDIIFATASVFIDFEIIAFKKMEAGQAYAVAALNLKNLAQTHGIDSKEFNDARIAATADLAKFIKFNG